MPRCARVATSNWTGNLMPGAKAGRVSSMALSSLSSSFVWCSCKEHPNQRDTPDFGERLGHHQHALARDEQQQRCRRRKAQEQDRLSRHAPLPQHDDDRLPARCRHRAVTGGTRRD